MEERRKTINERREEADQGNESERREGGGQFREKEGNNGPGKDDGEDEEVNVRRQQRMGHKIWRGKSRKNQRQKD